LAEAAVAANAAVSRNFPFAASVAVKAGLGTSRAGRCRKFASFARLVRIIMKARALIIACVLAVSLDPQVVRAQSPAPGASTAPMPAGSAPAATASAAPAPAASGDAAAIDPAIVTRAKDWLHRIQTAKLDRSQLTDQMNATLTDTVASGAAAQFGALGDPTAFTFVDKKSIQTGSAASATIYRFRVTFPSTTLYWLFVVDDAGKIGGLRFAPVPAP
jgi:hypothetical protein